jgi:hypothetical protein
VDKFFKLASSLVFSLAKLKKKKLAKNIEGVSECEKTLARLASVFFLVLLANPDFYSYLASWRVVICTPGIGAYLIMTSARA